MIWSVGINYPPTATQDEIDLLQEGAVAKLKEYCQHIVPNNLTINYADPKDGPYYDDEGHEVPTTVVTQELWVECPYCETAEHDPNA